MPLFHSEDVRPYRKKVKGRRLLVEGFSPWDAEEVTGPAYLLYNRKLDTPHISLRPMPEEPFRLPKWSTYLGVIYYRGDIEPDELDVIMRNYEGKHNYNWLKSKRVPILFTNQKTQIVSLIHGSSLALSCKDGKGAAYRLN